MFLRAVRFIFFNSSSFGWGGDGGMGGWRDGRCTVARILTLIVDYS